MKKTIIIIELLSLLIHTSNIKINSYFINPICLCEIGKETNNYEDIGDIDSPHGHSLDIVTII